MDDDSCFLPWSPLLDHLLLGHVLDLGELDMLMMTPFSQVDVVAVEDHVWFEDRWMVVFLCDE
jgi:hypothetical protein